MSSAAKAREMETNAKIAMDTIVFIVLAGRRNALSHQMSGCSSSLGTMIEPLLLAMENLSKQN